jgi:hypothetical protein
MNFGYNATNKFCQNKKISTTPIKLFRSQNLQEWLQNQSETNNQIADNN